MPPMRVSAFACQYLDLHKNYTMFLIKCALDFPLKFKAALTDLRKFWHTIS